MGCCNCCYSERAQRERARKGQESEERAKAKYAIKKFCEEISEINDHYSLAQNGDPSNIGGRLNKYWFLLKKNELTNTTADAEEKALLTLSPVSKRSPIETFHETNTIEELRGIFNKISKRHPYVHSIDGVWYLEDEEQLVTLQMFMERSLRDYLCKEYPFKKKKRKRRDSFLVSWSKKYSETRELESIEIALIGRQILEAMKFLYNSGFPVLGHIHSGNIFVEADADGHVTACQVAGYDMLLLGYRTRLYGVIKASGNLHRIDMIMFGHVVFEMATGCSLTEAVPTESEYNDYVKSEDMKRILKLIFTDGTTVKKLLQDHFFKNVSVQSDLPSKVNLTADEKKLVKLVSEPYFNPNEAKSLSEHWRDFKKAFHRKRRSRRRQGPVELSRPLLPATS